MRFTNNDYKNRANISKGTSLLSAKPFVYVLKSLFRWNRCDNCFASSKLLKCSACQCVYYCDRHCQKESWGIHKFECTNLKRISPRIIPDAARLMARIVIKLNKGGADEQGFYTETRFRKFKDLMSHYSDLKQDVKRMEHFTSLCGVLFEVLGETLLPNSAELMGIYGRLCVNSFNILDSEMNSIGTGVYLGPSVMDHSCKPNAVAVFEGTTITIRALEDIPRLDWSEIRISYIDLLNSTEERQTELQAGYYFRCNCERCTSPEPFVMAAACPSPSCDAPCFPSEESCSECGEKLPETLSDLFEEVTEFTLHHLQSMKTVAYLDVSKICLKKQEGVLHSLNLQHVRTLDAAFEAAVNLGTCWEDAEHYGTKLIPGYLLYYGAMHPLTGLLYLKLGKIQLYLGKSNRAVDTLKKAAAVLTVTHGDQHSLVREQLRPLTYQAISQYSN
ncbi:histone-lysine N-methyltransferase SMYD3 isoform X1 [Neodiprion lecontei]|uniref:Histone-lysine N-methyltransferase SMYD3 isoform X1 n=2 Tax=Neodiprion lecontei TaxID=441921 RepID=A0A6J0BBI2_NEOLC|nr:histone-lysine N-methyltransferase SMYD3 isoform X1 [Neodiprion lecontei]